MARRPQPARSLAVQVLRQLEETDRKSPVNALIDDLPLFSAMRPQAAAATATDPLAELLDGIHPDEMTPRDALEALYRLKAARAADRKS